MSHPGWPGLDDEGAVERHFRASAVALQIAEQHAAKRTTVAIGARYPGRREIVRRDDATGTFEHLLPRPTQDDERLQAALLQQPPRASWWRALVDRRNA